MELQDDYGVGVATLAGKGIGDAGVGFVLNESNDNIDQDIAHEAGEGSG